MGQASYQDDQQTLPAKPNYVPLLWPIVLYWLFFGLSLIWHAFSIAGLLSALVFSFWLPQTSMLSTDKQSEADQ